MIMFSSSSHLHEPPLQDLNDYNDAIEGHMPPQQDLDDYIVVERSVAQLVFPDD
jgi:hypothetical protein